MKCDGNVDYSLVKKRSELFLCSACLRAGFSTPVPQVVSSRHRPRTLCAACLESKQPSRAGPADH
jgi:hypothetical protein